MQCAGQKLKGICVPVPKSSREWEQILVSEIAIHFFACLFEPKMIKKKQDLYRIHSPGDLSRKATEK